MNRIINVLCISLIAGIGFISCSKDEVESPEINQSDNPETIATKPMNDETEIFALSFVYQGVKYSSLAESRNDSIFILDPEVEAKQNEIFANPNSVSLIQEGYTEYFDSQEEFLSAFGIQIVEEDEIQTIIKRRKMLRDPQWNSLAYAKLWDDRNFKDTNLELDLTDVYHQHEITRMKDKGLNDKVSSLKVQYTLGDPNYCAILTVWEDSDYNFGDDERTKHRTNFVAYSHTTHPEWPNLKKVSCWKAHDSWNDRISSLIFRIGSILTIPDPY